MRTLRKLFTSLMLLLCITSNAYDFEVDGIYYNIRTAWDTRVVVTNGPNRYSGAITIPSTVTYEGKEYTVTEIWINDCSDLTSVKMLGSIDWISGFGNCNNLTSINLSNVRNIAPGAFSGCKNLKKVQLTDEYGNSLLEEIGAGAFSGCTSLKYIQLPTDNYLRTIGDEAFYNTGIEIIIIPESVTSIGRAAFGDHLPLVVFRHLTAPEQMAGCGGIGLIPEGANGYDSDEDGMEYHTYSGGAECFTREDKLYIWGETKSAGVGEELITIENVVFTPDASKGSNYFGESVCTRLPNVKNLEVLDGFACFAYTYFSYVLYTIEGSNAVFMGDNELVVGCAATIIPEETTSIASCAFANCSGLESIEIPNSVVSIGWGAFKNCTNLTSIEIPSSVTTIHPRAFEDCFITNIIVDEGNTVYDSRENCNAVIETANNNLIIGVGNTVIPSSVTSIADFAFSACSNMDVTVPASVTSIGQYAFKGTKCLYFESETPVEINGDIFGWGAIFVPSTTYDTYCNTVGWSDYKDRIVTREMSEKIIESASTEGMSGVLDAVGLNGADKVVKLKVKGKINSYDMIVFRDKMPLLNELDLSEATVIASNKPYFQNYCTGNNTFGGYAFSGLDKLVSVKLPQGLTQLGDYSFYECRRLTSVDASAAGELDLGVSTFSSTSLREFVAPSIIERIGQYAFGGCNIKDIELHRINGSIERSAFYSSKIKNVNIEFIGGDIETNAFNQCAYVREVKIDTLMGCLEDKSFTNCRLLRSVEFKRGPVQIGSRVFAFSNNLEDFVAGEGLTDVAAEAFYDYFVQWYYLNGRYVSEDIPTERTALKRVVLPQSTQRIGSKAFYLCSSLNDFSIPQSVTSIGTEAFKGCTSLENVVIPNGMTVLADAVFKYCSSLRSITFPEKLTTIGSETFAGCAFEQLSLPTTLTTIGSSAFSGCDSLTELHIPSAMEYIGNYAFSGCSKLNEIYTYTVEPTTITETTFSTFASATLHVPATSFWNYYWDIGWSRFNHKYFKDFNEKYDYFYLNNDYYLNGETGYIDGTPDADLRPGSGLVVESDKDAENDDQTLGDVTVGSDGNGNSGSIIGDENLSIENLHVKINVKGGRWYFFAFPWDVPFEKISMQNGSDYVFRHYDGDERAKHGHGGWKDVNESHLKAARGYIFQCSADDVLLISIEDVKFKKEDKYNELVTHASESLNDASWNLMGNPYLSYYDMAAMDYSAPVTVWDGEKYVAVRPGDDDYQFAPYEAFFVQKPEGKDNVGFRGDDQMTKTQAATAMAQQAKARRTRAIDPNRLIVNLELSIDSISDRTRVVFNNNQSHNYETACDAAKFESAGVPQLYTIDNEGVHYAINERPVDNGVVLIGYTATDNGYYTIEASRMDTKVYLYDAETKIMHNLDEGSYTFFSGKGTFEGRFSLGVRNGEATGIENLDIDNVIEAVEGGILINGNATATVYNAAGMLVAVQNGAGLVQLPAGTYVVSVGEQNKKVVVK